ncbi:MAG TPA: alpha/beta hydrolase fold domain-containing protein, partial [Chloroflexota bacterium]|nr:alpha/beta hydrolase fold domain-containing protein [Chloroflexota bacterium]
LTTGLAAVPLVQAWQVAREARVTLSPFRTLVGSSDPFQGQVQTVTYSSADGKELLMDVYFPDNTPVAAGAGAGVASDPAPSAQLRPAVIVVHGGSWNGSYRSESPRWSRWLAARGYVVFDIDYRLAPQPNWQTATGDVKCAIGTIERQAARWQIDLNRVALLGRSAGAHLSLLAGYSTGDPVLRPSCDVVDTSAQAVVALYGPTDLLWGYDHPGNSRVIDGRETLRRFLGGTPQTVGENYFRASPVTHVGRNTPPTLLIHGGRDQYVRVQHTMRLAERLQEAGVPHKAIILPYAQHGFDYVFDGWGGQIAQVTIADFLAEYLGTFLARRAGVR